MTIPVIFTVTDDRGGVLPGTDDWAGAESCAVAGLRKRRLRNVRGTHPAHDWHQPGRSPGNPDGIPRCRACGGWDNGSYESHAPCGYDFRGESLIAALERENTARASQGGHT